MRKLKDKLSGECIDDYKITGPGRMFKHTERKEPEKSYLFVHIEILFGSSENAINKMQMINLKMAEKSYGLHKCIKPSYKYILARKLKMWIF